MDKGKHAGKQYRSITPTYVSPLHVSSSNFPQKWKYVTQSSFYIYGAAQGCLKQN